MDMAKWQVAPRGHRLGDMDTGRISRDGTSYRGGARNTTHRPEGIGTFAFEGDARNTKRRP